MTPKVVLTWAGVALVLVLALCVAIIIAYAVGAAVVGVC